MRNTTRSGRLALAAPIAGAVLLTAASILSAHDFWLVPNALTFAPGATIEVLGQSGTRFPTSDAATQPAQVAEARVVGARSDERIGDIAISGKSLMLRAKPARDGQYVVAVSLTSRNARTTPARLQRYIALEGAPELAARYEQEGKYPKADSVTQTSAKFAKTIVEVGSGGRRAFDKVLGQAMELVPLQDPARLGVGDSLSIRVLFHGKAAANVHLRAGSAPPSALQGDSAALAAAALRATQVIVTDAKGIARFRVSDGGLWNVRTLFAAPMAGMPEHWELFFSTMVFSVSGGTDGDSDDGFVSPAPNDSADVVAALDRFHAALAAGDSAAVLAFLAPDVAIVESGGVETLSGYRSGHLRSDIEFAKAIPSQRTATSVQVRGDAAWVVATSVTQGDFRGRAVNSVGAELAVLAREGGTWRLKAIHWSSRTRRAP
jgi:ketosteroid isomerase-like protein